MLQSEITPLERARSGAERSGRLIDLIDTNFHRNGLRFPAELLQQPVARYLDGRCYAPEAKGAYPARRAIAGFYAEDGCIVDPDQVVITASASESYNLLFQCLAQSGDEVLLPSPGYPLFEHVAVLARLAPRHYRLAAECEFVLSAAEIQRSLTPRTRFVVLISPHNPTGHVASDKEIAAVLELCANNGIQLICDEVFSDLLHDHRDIPGGDRPDRDCGAIPGRLPRSRVAAVISDPGRQPVHKPARLPRPMCRACEAGVVVFTINGVSKLFASPDLKLSWIVVSGPPGPRSRAATTLELANDMYLNCSPLAQELLPTMFDQGESFRADLRRTVKERRDIVLRGFTDIPGVEIVVPTGGIHAVLRLADARDDERFAIELLHDTGVHVHPGYLYGFPDEGYLVVSFLKDPAILRRGLGLLQEFMSATGGHTHTAPPGPGILRP